MTIYCGSCGKVVEQDLGPGRMRRYCGNKCRNRASRDRILDRRAHTPATTTLSTSICVCGRDYLTVPLEEAHGCVKHPTGNLDMC